MTDCSNAEMRDRLPDYVNELLSLADAAVVESHIESCDECSDEVALLRAVLAERPRAANINVAAIVTSLPRSHVADRSVRSISSAPSVVGKTSFRSWRSIAAVAILAVGGAATLVAKNGATNSVAVTSRPESTYVATTPVGTAVKPVSPETASAKLPVSNAKKAALSVGELSDYSDAEIEAVMARLEKWDGAASADPMPGVPLIPASSRGVR